MPPCPTTLCSLSRLLSLASPNQDSPPMLGIWYAHGRKTWRYFKDEQTSCQQEGTEMPRRRWPAARWARPRAGRFPPQGFQQAMARSMAGHQVHVCGWGGHGCCWAAASAWKHGGSLPVCPLEPALPRSRPLGRPGAQRCWRGRHPQRFSRSDAPRQGSPCTETSAASRRPRHGAAPRVPRGTRAGAKS